MFTRRGQYLNHLSFKIDYIATSIPRHQNNSVNLVRMLNSAMTSLPSRTLHIERLGARVLYEDKGLCNNWCTKFKGEKLGLKPINCAHLGFSQNDRCVTNYEWYSIFRKE